MNSYRVLPMVRYPTLDQQKKIVKDRMGRVKACAQQIREEFKENIDKVEIACVLGSGVGHYADQLEKAQTIKYEDIDFGTCAVDGHSGVLHLGKVPKTENWVLVMQGRVHFYEHYDMEQVTMPIRVFRELGIKVVVLTNATGGINPNFQAGDFMLISDHINFLPNPCVGPNISQGDRFFDMSDAYNKELRGLVKKAAQEVGTLIQEGVLVSVTGPSYESPAEIRAFRTLGADNVGMSITHECLVARHCGLRVVGISTITNKAAGLNEAPLNHEEVQEICEKRRPVYVRLMNKTMEKLSAMLEAEKKFAHPGGGATQVSAKISEKISAKYERKKIVRRASM